MTKRLLSLALIAMMLVMFIPSAQASWTMYVSPAQGSTVNLREAPSTESRLLIQVPYGPPVTVVYVSNGWAYIDYNVGSIGYGYIMVKYLTNDYVAPGPNNQKKSSGSSSQKSGGQTSSSDLAVHYQNMNEQFRSFRLVDRPFTVYGKPERATGWVNLRYAPDDKAELIRRVRQNEQLTVIGATSPLVSGGRPGYRHRRLHQPFLRVHQPELMCPSEYTGGNRS